MNLLPDNAHSADVDWLNRESMVATIFPDDTLTITTKSGATAYELNTSEIKAVPLTKQSVANRNLLNHLSSPAT